VVQDWTNFAVIAGSAAGCADRAAVRRGLIEP